MRFRLLVLLSALALTLLASAAMAHDGSFEWTFTSWDQQSSNHNDADPWKGYATITVYNSSTNYWGDFHFQIGGAPNVFILASPAPTSSIVSYAWSIGGGGTTLDYTFYSNPVAPSGTATFTFYTDNTLNKNAFFGLCGYPTPVPEPSSILAFSTGLLSLAGIVLRRRH